MFKDWVLILGWGSPVGVSILVLCLGIVIYLLMKANTDRKRFEEEKKKKE